MAFDGTDGPCWEADIPERQEEAWRLRIAQFGDGYSQKTLDGINALNTKFTVTFSDRPKDVILAMLAYLRTAKANAFTFKEPVSGVYYEVFCDQWSVDWGPYRPATGSAPRAYYGTLSAEFVRAYGVTA